MLISSLGLVYFSTRLAGVVELVDALDSKSGDGNIVRVQVSPPVPTNLISSLNNLLQHIPHLFNPRFSFDISFDQDTK